MQKHMKKILLMVALFAIACVVRAQEMLVATLDGPAGSQVFYGVDAFINAVDAAESGDRITLSGGTFNAPSINKSLKIQGAGFVSDPENGLYRTSLNGYLRVELPATDADNFLLEGIYSDTYLILTSDGVVRSFTLKKCRFQDIELGNCASENMLIQHCWINGTLDFSNSSCTIANASVINSIIYVIKRFNNTNATISFINTIIDKLPNHSRVGLFENCIFLHNSTGWWLEATNIIRNCVSFSRDIFRDIKTQQNAWIATEADLFMEEIKGYREEATYELKEEAKAAYKGTDGSEIGIHGGYLPYSAIPSNPQVVDRRIASRPANGRLDVSLTAQPGVEAYEYWFDTDDANRKSGSSTGTLETSLEIPALSEGMHYVTIRFRDASGQWSSPVSQRFYHTATVTGLEAIEALSPDACSLEMPAGVREATLRFYDMRGQQKAVFPLSDLTEGTKDLRPFQRDLATGTYILRIEILTDQGRKADTRKLWISN